MERIRYKGFPIWLHESEVVCRYVLRKWFMSNRVAKSIAHFSQ